MPEYIDVTPKWKALVPAMLAVIENHEDTPSGWAAHGNIFAEFMRMADAADRWNEYVADLRVKHEDAGGDEHDQNCVFCEPED